jgi:hypothetical protein
MKPDESFEQRLKNVPLKPLPIAWRQKILDHAEPSHLKNRETGALSLSPCEERAGREPERGAVELTASSPQPSPPSFVRKRGSKDLSAFLLSGNRDASALARFARDFIKGMFWPHPRAWAALGAAWVLILVANLQIRDDSPALARNHDASAPQVEQARQQKAQLYAELGLLEARDADRPKKNAPRPRSDRASACVKV